MKTIKVREIIGQSVEPEDAIVLRDFLNQNLQSDKVVLDFEGIDNVKCTFIMTMLTDLINKKGRHYIEEHLSVKNLSNADDFIRVLYGTTCKYKS